MIDAQQMHAFQSRLDAAHPPVETIGFHDVPTVQGIAPALTGFREVVGWYACHFVAQPLFVDREPFALSPDVDGIMGDIDRQITEQQHVPGFGMGLQPFPLAFEQKLLEDALPDQGAMFSAYLGQGFWMPVTQWLGPAPPRLVV